MENILYFCNKIFLFLWSTLSSILLINNIINQISNTGFTLANQVCNVLLAHFGTTREGYDVQYFTKNELISDVLKHYDRFLKIIAEEPNEMFISSDNNSKID